jgi:hypothetical protein
MDETLNLLAERTKAAEALLHESVRLDAVLFIDRQFAERLRRRPHLLADLSNANLAFLRRTVDNEADKLAADLNTQINDLRVHYSSSPARSVEEEARGLGDLLKRIGETAKKLLRKFMIPGDDRPDLPGEQAVTLDEKHQINYEPSPLVVHAWQRVRELDGILAQVIDKKLQSLKGNLEPTFAVRLYLPEAVPDAKR